jgi:hypothetical protein
MKSNCLTCGVEFSFSPSQKTGKYCSNKCQQKYQSNKLLTEWLNGEYDSKKGIPPEVAKKWISEQQNHKCLMCGISDWNSKPITFQFDHIDGNPDNNTKDNIRMLCPNCHSQTDTFGVKNKKSKNTQRNIYRRKNYRDKASNVNLSKDA